jgi:hypothetical protein
VIKSRWPWWASGLAALLGCTQGPERLAGNYHSTWGLCVVEVRGREAAIHYPRGVMNCRIEEPATFRCRWQSGEAQGKAVLRAQKDGTLRGTWGRAESEEDGGAWVLAR